MAPELANTVLRWKGVVLDSLLEDKNVASKERDPGIKDLVNELRARYDALDKLPLELGAAIKEPETVLTPQETIHARITELEKQLASRVNGYGRIHRALEVSYQNVESALEAGTTLIEFIRCPIYAGKGNWVDRYGALVIPHEGAPGWIELGDAATIDKIIVQFQQGVSNGSSDLHSSCRNLYDLLVGPVIACLGPATDHLIISPDGELSFLPFAVLVSPDDTFLGQQYAIGYVASGRDLLRRSAASPSQMNRLVEIFANPEFSVNASVQPDSSNRLEPLYRELGQTLPSNVRLNSLPGTTVEANLIRNAAEKNGLKQVILVEGSQATKQAVFQLRSPWVLHLATHAFVLSKEQLPIDNPMHRCALAFAGAQDTLQAWAQGKFPPHETDGIILADDAARIDLEGTWLVTLSACETGAGEVDAGEGVLGLRRGFAMTGAENLLFTLWRIGDSETADFMSAFYRRALAGQNPLDALAETQREALVRLRQEQGLAVAIRSAGPFVLTAQTAR
jgi:CHAT domain-containing protein